MRELERHVRHSAYSLARRIAPRALLITRGAPSENAVYLTFDDGPHPEHTPRVLEALRRCKARATFFVVGHRMRRHPDLVRRIVDEGHAVGNHTFSHSEPHMISASQLVAEVRATAALLSEATGCVTRLFRPPKASLTIAKTIALWRAHQTIVMWSVDPRDYRCESASQLARVLAERPLRAGDIVLFHDTYPRAAQCLPTLIAESQQRGLTFLSLPGGRNP